MIIFKGENEDYVPTQLCKMFFAIKAMEELLDIEQHEIPKLLWKAYSVSRYFELLTTWMCGTS
jgi:hypothetical protein